MSVMSTFRAILETTNLGALLSLGSTADVMLKKPWIVLMGTDSTAVSSVLQWPNMHAPVAGVVAKGRVPEIGIVDAAEHAPALETDGLAPVRIGVDRAQILDRGGPRQRTTTAMIGSLALGTETRLLTEIVTMTVTVLGNDPGIAMIHGTGIDRGIVTNLGIEIATRPGTEVGHLEAGRGITALKSATEVVIILQRDLAMDEMTEKCRSTFYLRKKSKGAEIALF